jgi:hypothetical protein
MVHDVAAHVIADRLGVPDRPAEQVLHPVWGGSPACSAIVQQFLRGNSALQRSATSSLPTVRETVPHCGFNAL